MKHFKSDKFIYSLIIGALFLRLPGVFDGLPAVYNSTEYFLSKITLNMAAHFSLDPSNYIYPALYNYFLLIIYGIYFFLGLFYGVFPNGYVFAVQFLVDPSGFYIFARSVNVLISLATVVVIYHFLRRYKGESLARITAIIAVLNLHLIQFSAFATADTILVFFSSLSVLSIYRLYHAPSNKNFFFSGLFCGLAIAAKYNAAVIIIGLIVAHHQIWSLRKTKYSHTALSLLSGIVLGFLITNPYWLLQPQKYIEGFQIISQQMYSAVSLHHGINYLWEIMTLIKNELLLGILFIISTGFIIWKERKKQLPFILIVLVAFIYVGSWRKKGIDYLFAIFPIWFIFSAIFIQYVSEHICKKRRTRVILFLLLFAPSTLMACYNALLHIRMDTREQVTDWIITFLDKDSTICYDNTHYDLGLFDIDRYISYGKGSMYLPAKVKKYLEAFRDHERNIKFLPILSEDSTNVRNVTSSYEIEQSRYRRKTLPELINEKADYFITNSNYYQPYLQVSSDEYNPVIRKRIDHVQIFYYYLFANYKPIVVFTPGLWAKGPELRIYQLNNDMPGGLKME